MTSAITGAAVGFLVWAGLALSWIIRKGWPLPRSWAPELALLTGIGAAIGWLVR